LTREGREALQVALKWAGFYDGPIDGAFGRGTRGSMAAWQGANAFEPTGILTTLQRETLLRQYNAVLEGLDLQMVHDETAGIEMMLPLGVVALDRVEPPFVHYEARGDIDALWPEIAESVSPHRLLVQEFIGAVRTSGQISFIFFDGIFSHAAQLIPRAGEFRINSAFQPEKRAYIPAPGELAQASSVLEKLPERPLYARIDGIFDGPDFVLLEAEVNEPGLFLDLDPQAAMRFAAASLAWLAR